MISPQNNLELHLGCHACWLSYFTSVYLWCGRTVGRAYGYVITKLPNFLTHGAPLRACGAPLQQEIPQQSFGVSTFLYGEQNKFYKSGDLFCLLFTLLAAIFSSCRFTNQPNRGKSRGVSRILGFPGKCFLFSCNHPPSIFHFFCSSYLYCYFSPSTNRCELTTTVPFNDQRSPGVQSLVTKVRDGRLISMVVIGGSNTAGRNRKKNKELYSSRFTDWWNKDVYKSTGSRLTLNIMGIGGSSSDLLLFCLQNYLPKKQPDIVLIEFAVNEFGKYGKAAQPMELLTRRLLLMASRPLVMYVNLVNPGIIKGKVTNTNCQNMEDLGLDDLAKYYGIPSVSMKDFVCPLTSSSRRKFKAKMDLFEPDGMHAGRKSHKKIASMIIEYFRIFLATKDCDRSVKGKSNKKDSLSLLKPLFSDPSISDIRLGKAMCWTHLTPNWKIPLKQSLKARVIASCGFAYVSPLMSLKNRTFDRSTRHMDGFGGWACQPEKGTKNLTVQFIVPNTNPLVLPSISVVLRLNYTATMVKMSLDDEQRSCIVVKTETQRKKWLNTRIYPLTSQITPGKYTLRIECTARWMLVCGIVIGYHGYHGFEGYKPIDEKVINCSNKGGA